MKYDGPAINDEELFPDDYQDDTVTEGIATKEYLEECDDFFDLVDKLLICQLLSPEDEEAICQMDLAVADSNAVTTEQFDFLDSMAKKYKLEEEERGGNA